MNSNEIYEAAFQDELQKIAEEAPEKNTSYLKGQLAAFRALSPKDKARYGLLIRKPKDMLPMMGAGLRGVAEGGVGGAGVGAGVGALVGALSKSPGAAKAGAAMGATVGGALGASGGAAVRTAMKQKKILAERGITYKGTMIPRGFHLTDEAKAKYRV